MGFSRREFIAGAAAGASMLSIAPGRALGREARTGAAARWHRHDAASPQGKRMLASYARGVEAMLALPPDHPHNWFRNAFVHLMDCPHGNWWFYVWHRGYVGYFEQTIRRLSGDADFAMPFWDWTRHPEIPAEMFEGVLTPTALAYAPVTGNLARFTARMQRPLLAYWNALSAQQRAQLERRGYATFDQLWNDVTGYSASAKTGISGNAAYAITCGARFLSKDNPKLDPKTTVDVSPDIIRAGLSPTAFYDAQISLSFTSSKTASHVIQPDGTTQFSVLEGFPHNKVHNCIGGVGAIDPGPYGNMTNFLSPVDPIFYLHHSNMDRLWDVWARKQIAQGRSILPDEADRQAFMDDPFLFFVDAEGRSAGARKAGDFFSTAAFDYDYVGGFAEDLDDAPAPALRAAKRQTLRGARKADAATVAVPQALVREHLSASAGRPLIAEVTLRRPEGPHNTREFDVLVNAPPGTTRVDADSPHFAGTIAFFGPAMSGMEMSHAATFAVPLPRRPQVFGKLAAGADAPLEIRLVPSSGQAPETVPVQDAAIVPGGG